MKSKLASEIERCNELGGRECLVVQVKLAEDQKKIEIGLEVENVCRCDSGQLLNGTQPIAD